MNKNRKTYSSDTTEVEWERVMPYLPLKGLLGRPMTTDWREIIDAIFYVLHEGCTWRGLPGEFPPWQTIYRYYRKLCKQEWWQSLNDYLSVELRLQSGREANPSAASLDSQTIQSSDTGCYHGWDEAKKTKGIKRHILVDTEGYLITAVVHDAATCDGDGAKAVLEQAKKKGRTERLDIIWADSAYHRTEVYTEAGERGWTVEIIRRSDNTSGFKLLPRRWVVERTFSWLAKNRRLSRDYERKEETAKSLIYMAMCRLMLRRLAKTTL